jgi:hypothetical protein
MSMAWPIAEGNACVGVLGSHASCLRTSPIERLDQDLNVGKLFWSQRLESGSNACWATIRQAHSLRTNTARELKVHLRERITEK